MADNFGGNFSVDDILKEVREMKESARSVSAVSNDTRMVDIDEILGRKKQTDKTTSDTEMNEPFEKTMQFDISEKVNASDDKDIKQFEDTVIIEKDLIDKKAAEVSNENDALDDNKTNQNKDEIVEDVKDNTSAEDKIEAEENRPTYSKNSDKLNKFFAKTRESTYTPNTDLAKMQVDALYNDFSGDEPMVDRRGRRKMQNKNLLSADEINAQGRDKRARKDEQLAEYNFSIPGNNNYSINSEELNSSSFNSEFENVEIAEAPLELNDDAVILDFETDVANLAKNNQDEALIKDDVYEKISDISNDEKPQNDGIEQKKFRTIEDNIIQVDDGSAENDEFVDEYNDDYRSIEDAEDVRSQLDGKLHSFSKKSVITFIMFLLLGVLTVLPSLNVELPSIINPSTNIYAFLIINIALLAVAVITNIKTVVNGIFSLFRLNAGMDSAVAVAAVAAVVQSVCAFSFAEKFASYDSFIYSAIAVGGLWFNLLGKKNMFTRIRRNFDLVATTGVKQSCFVEFDDIAVNIANDETVADYGVVCSKPVLNLHGFINHSVVEDPFERLCMILAPIGLLIAALTGMVTYFITNSAVDVLGAIVVVLSAAVPFASILSTNVPLKKACEKANKHDSMISGFDAIEYFKDVQCAVFDAKQLFPAGTIELLSLNAVGNHSIDDAIMDAAALVKKAGSPISDVFDRMIEGRLNNLKRVTGVVYVDKLGLSGTVGFDTISVGNRAMIEQMGDVNLPDVEVERKLNRKGCFMVYIARNDQLCGMIAVKYTVKDEDIAEQIYNLTEEGVKVLVESCDPNITSGLIARLFEINEFAVEIMSSNSVDEYSKSVAPAQNGDGVLAHHNSAAGLACALTAIKRVKSVIKMGLVLQIIGVVLGIALSVFMIITASHTAVTPALLLCYQLFTCLITIMVLSVKRI